MKSRIAAVLAAFVLLGAPAVAQTASGYVGQGKVLLSPVFMGQRFNIGGNVRLVARPGTYRLDLDGLSMPGTDATFSAFAAQFLPQGAYTVVYSSVTRTTTMWSATRRTYTVMQRPAAEGSSTAVAAPGDPLAGLLTNLRSINQNQVFSFGVSMAGHGHVSGHPTTGYDINYKQQKPHEQLTTLTVHLDSANDLDAFPIRLTGSLHGPFSGSCRLEFTSLQRAAVDDSQFAIPAGYTQVSDPSGVFGKPPSL